MCQAYYRIAAGYFNNDNLVVGKYISCSKSMQSNIYFPVFVKPKCCLS